MKLNYRNKNKIGSTLTDIVAALAVVSVIILIGLASFQSIQRNSRDSQRVAVLARISDEINSYKLTNFRYPASVQFTSTTVVIVGQSVITLDDHLIAATSTSSSQTEYFYAYRTDGNYAVCLRLEGASNRIENGGTSNCTVSEI